jgi:hypothetical protein
MPKVSGTVYRQGSEERIEYASVRATQGKQVEYRTTDDDGDFEFELGAGKWALVALHEKSLANKPMEVDLATEDKSSIRIDLPRFAESVELKLGQRFWVGLVIALALLVALYVALHIAFPLKPTPLGATLPTLIAEAQKQLEKTDKPSGSAELMVAIAQLNSTVGVLVKSRDLNAADQAAAAALLSAIEAAVADNRGADAKAGLASLGQLIRPLSEPVVGPWGRDTWRFLEVLLWGLAGILVNKIIKTGWYLRSQRFYREGIVMHLAHIFTTPLLVLVVVLLLSLATLSVTLASGNQLTLDLSDPRILIAVSFLLASSPWQVWGFIQDTAERITGKLG